MGHGLTHALAVARTIMPSTRLTSVSLITPQASSVRQNFISSYFMWVFSWRRLPSASDSNAAREEEDMMVGRTLSVPWIRGHAWAGTPEELEEAWAAEVSRGCAAACTTQQCTASTSNDQPILRICPKGPEVPLTAPLSIKWGKAVDHMSSIK